MPTDGSANKPMIVFDKVVKQFGDHVVLDHLDFRVDRGERVALIGPSGSGKTTILRLLMTIEKVNGGVIWVEDEPLSHQYKGDKLVVASEKHLRAVRTKIGMVFQQFNLFPNMTVIENITEAPVHVLGKSKAEASNNKCGRGGYLYRAWWPLAVCCLLFCTLHSQNGKPRSSMACLHRLVGELLPVHCNLWSLSVCSD